MRDYVNKVIKILGAYKYVLLVIAVGLIFLLWPNAPPSGSAILDSALGTTEQGAPASSALEQSLEAMLNGIEGVGRADLLLTDKGALIVCDGAADSGIRMKLLEAVSSVTNLSYDKISVIKKKS